MKNDHMYEWICMEDSLARFLMMMRMKMKYSGILPCCLMIQMKKLSCLVEQFPELKKQFNDPRSITQAFGEKTRNILWYAQVTPSETQRKQNKLHPSDENLPKWKLYNKNKIREN